MNDKAMRVGRHLGRTLYLVPKDDLNADGEFVGVADTVELAEEIVLRWNLRVGSQAEPHRPSYGTPTAPTYTYTSTSYATETRLTALERRLSVLERGTNSISEHAANLGAELAVFARALTKKIDTATGRA